MRVEKKNADQKWVVFGPMGLFIQPFTPDCIDPVPGLAIVEHALQDPQKAALIPTESLGKCDSSGPCKLLLHENERAYVTHASRV